MASHEGLRHVSIGRYIPTGSPIHSLDPRAKWIAFGLLLACIVVATGYINNALLLLAVIALTIVSRLPIGYLLRTVKPALPIILLLAIFQLLFYRGPGNGAAALSWGRLTITYAAIRVVIVSLARFIDLLFLISLLTNTTTVSQLTWGLERLLQPLDRLRLPGHELAMMGAISLRFLPILGEEMEAIMQARESRQLVSNEQTKWRFVQNARRTASLLIPLFVDAYRRAEGLVIAMQARCYAGGRGRTSYIQRQMTARDAVTLVLSVVALILTIATQYARLP